MEQSQAKRPRPPEEAEQVSATPIAPHGLWPRPHHPQQPCWPPPWRAADCRPHQTQTPTRPEARRTHWACLMAEASPTLVTVAPPRRRGPRPGGPYGHKTHAAADTHHNRPHQRPQPDFSTQGPACEERGGSKVIHVCVCHGASNMHQGVWASALRVSSGGTNAHTFYYDYNTHV